MPIDPRINCASGACCDGAAAKSATMNILRDIVNAHHTGEIALRSGETAMLSACADKMQEMGVTFTSRALALEMRRIFRGELGENGNDVGRAL